MYREFISPAEEKKLAIFKYVCNSNGVTLVKLSEALKIPLKSLQKYIYFLNEDLQQLSPTLLLNKTITINILWIVVKKKSNLFIPS